MINMPYDDIIERIKEEKSINDQELKAKIEAKMEQLSGLISKEGAAYIVANDLGVKLIQTEGQVKIKNIVSGQRSVETAGIVTRIYDMVEFERENGKGKVRNMMISDETGQIRVTAWHEQTDLMAKLQEGDTVKIMNGFVKGNQGTNEIHLNTNSKLVANPSDVKISGVQVEPKLLRKKISELKEGENSEIFATIVQAYDPRYYEQCPECRKRPVQKENGFACEKHGTITPIYGYVTNVVLDDGSDSIRVVMFREQMQQLFNKTDAELQTMRTATEKFEDLKTELLGEQIIVTGRVVKNDMFERLELRAQKVNRKVDPDKEIENLKTAKLPSVEDL